MNNYLGILKDSMEKAILAMRPRPVVCHELRLIYYPIPKVASSSIRGYLLKNGFLKDYEEDQGLTMERIHHGFAYPTISAKEAEELKKNGYRSFAVVRDPMARSFSCYKDKIAGYRESGQPLRYGFSRYNRLFMREVFSTDMSFEQFLCTVARIPDFIADEHFRSQACFLPIRHNSLMVDQLVQLENLDAGMVETCIEWGLPPWSERRINPTRQSMEPQNYKAHLYGIVSKRYRRDYELTGYSAPSERGIDTKNRTR